MIHVLRGGAYPSRPARLLFDRADNYRYIAACIGRRLLVGVFRRPA